MRAAREATIVLGRSNGWPDTLAYGVAHLGKSLFWYGSEVLFAFYLIELVGLSPLNMGIVVASGLATSAIIDVIVGFRLNGALNDARAAGRLQLRGSILCALTFSGVFLGFWIPPEWRFAYAVTAGISFRAAYAFYDIPQNALMSLATDDAEARSRVAATRFWFSGVATILVALAVGPLIEGRDDDGARLFLFLAVLIAAPSVLSAAFLAYRLAKGGHPKTTSRAIVQRFSMTTGLALMITLTAVTSFATPLYAKVQPFFAAYVLHSPTLGGTLIIAMAIGLAASQPLWARIAMRLGLITALSVAAALQIVALIGTGLVTPWSVPLLICAVLFGAGNGGIAMALWTAFSDTVAREAEGSEGAAYGLFTATAKLSLALGGLALGLLLGLIDYHDSEAAHLTLLMIAVPLMGATGCLIIAGFWARQEAGRG